MFQHSFSSAPGELPASVHAELVDMLFTAMLSIVIMGGSAVCIGALIAVQAGDTQMGVLAAAIGLMTLVRIGTLLAHRRRAPDAGISSTRRWERLYAMGAIPFAALIGALNARALMLPDPLAHMLATSLVFGYGAGVITRLAIRPRLCIAAMTLAVVPTVAGMLYRVGDGHVFLDTPVYAIQALVVILFALGSLETARHLNRATIGQLVIKHDLTFLARQDALTGLANRLSLRERFDASIAPVAGARHGLALHFLDLDGFKAINDTYGHPTGDAMLKEVSQRLTRMVRAGDTVARTGGDEFVVVQAEIGHEGEAEMLARRIVRTLSAPYTVGGKTMYISASVGIALAPEHGLDLEKLAACADSALYRAKGSGKGRIVFCGAEQSSGPIAAVA